MANADDPSSMVGILTISMSQILQASSRKHKQLRDSAQFVTDELKSNSNGNSADAFFLPLKLACEVKVGKVMEIALDCIQKLIAYGYLRGSGPIDRTQFPLDTVGKTDGADSTSSNQNPRQSPRKLIDLIIETVYDCSTFQDDGVQLQVFLQFFFFFFIIIISLLEEITNSFNHCFRR
jgi:brefeldin A-inhibited guanine nucleotide-exchange protein